MPDKPQTVEVPPVALLVDDVLLRDPDAPEREIHWTVTAVHKEGDVFVAEYVTDDGTEGSHGFEDLHGLNVLVTVSVRRAGASLPEPAPVTGRAA